MQEVKTGLEQLIGVHKKPVRLFKQNIKHSVTSLKWVETNQLKEVCKKPITQIKPLKMLCSNKHECTTSVHKFPSTGLEAD